MPNCFLKENTEVKILNYKGTPLNVELPTFIELVIVKTDPGYQGRHCIRRRKAGNT